MLYRYTIFVISLYFIFFCNTLVPCYALAEPNLYAQTKNNLSLGGSLQIDYRYYGEDTRADNRFDIRQARLSFAGDIKNNICYKALLEFQGNELKNLIDAYINMGDQSWHDLKIGQFTEPFGLESQTTDRALFFAERSMGYYLTPQRDIGLMIHGNGLQKLFTYAIGIFNGDGRDGSTRGTMKDDPELAYRLTLSPFSKMYWPWLKSWNIGGSFTYARIDLANVDIEVKSTGMVGTDKSAYVLNQNTKYGLLQAVDQRYRKAFEMAWAYGPLALQGEYIHLRYTELQADAEKSEDANFFSWYCNLLILLTGEYFQLNGPFLLPVKPKEEFQWKERTWGGFGIAMRFDHFQGDETWILKDNFVSVKKADAYSIALKWFLNSSLCVMADYTHTNFSNPIRVSVNPADGHVEYITKERVITIRFHLSF